MSNIPTPLAYSQMSYFSRENLDEAYSRRDISMVGYTRPNGTDCPKGSCSVNYAGAFLQQGESYVYQSPFKSEDSKSPKHIGKGMARY